MDLKKELKHLYYWIFIAKSSGCKLKKKDKRNYKAEDIGWGFGYTPKSDERIIKTLSIKNQSPNNTCTVEAGVVQKEVDEGVVLSVGSAVTKQRKLGLLKGNGWASVEGIQKVLKSWGVMEEKDAPTKRDWNSLSNTPINDIKASEHKTESYWEVNTRNGKLKAIDDGKVITTAIDWFTGYNASYINDKFLIEKRNGYYVGGHSVAIIGYDMDYFGKQVYICQNSYGENWGDNGKFYITMDFLDKEAKYGSFINLDIAKESGITSDDIVSRYNFKNVKGSKDNAIYLIYSGQKFPYKNAAAFVAYNAVPYFYKDAFTIVPQEELDKIPKPTDGGLLTLESGYGKYSEVVKNLIQPINNNFK